MNVSKSNAFELISITLALPSSHKMLLCGLYHPPKDKYNKCDLIEYISDIVDSFLQENQNSVVICGGYFNQLNTEEFSSATGLEILIDFPPEATLPWITVVPIVRIYLANASP